jgi:hypothetical protein
MKVLEEYAASVFRVKVNQLDSGILDRSRETGNEAQMIGVFSLPFLKIEW